MLASLAASALVVLAMVLLGEYTRTRGQVLLTLLVLAACCLATITPAALVRQRRWTSVGAAGMLTAAACFVVVTVGIWATPDPDAFWKAAAIVSVLAAGGFYASLCLLFQTYGRVWPRLLLLAPLGMTSLVLLMSVAGVLYEVTAAPHWWTVVIAVLLAMCGGAALLVVSRLGRSPG